jgi:hypothetical protein
MIATLLHDLEVPVDELTRRGLLTAAGAATLVAGLAACGGSPADPPSRGRTQSVRSGEGRLDIPDEPRRMVLTTHGWDAAVTLGVQDRVVGVAEWDLFLDYVEYLAETRTSSMTPLPALDGGGSVERIAALEPDLLVVPYWNSEDLATRDELARVAPFVELVVPGHPRPYDTWKGSLTAYAEVFGVPDRAARYISEHEEAARSLRGDLAAAGVDQERPPDGVPSRTGATRRPRLDLSDRRRSWAHPAGDLLAARGADRGGRRLRAKAWQLAMAVPLFSRYVLSHYERTRPDAATSLLSLDQMATNAGLNTVQVAEAPTRAGPADGGGTWSVPAR